MLSQNQEKRPGPIRKGRLVGKEHSMARRNPESSGGKAPTVVSRKS